MHGRWVIARRLIFATSVVVGFAVSRPSPASFLLGKPEKDSWSDMEFSGITGEFDADPLKKLFTLNASASSDLEIGSEFGPSNSGKHYGPGGTLGGPFGATLSIAGVVIQPNGAVTNGGTLTVTFTGSAPGSLGDDYGISPGAALLLGSVVEVGLGLNATGANTMDVVFTISGGALQTINPALGTNFSPSNLGLLRLKTTALPDDFSNSFSIVGNTTVDLYGTIVPEFRYTTLLFFGAIFVVGAWLRSRFVPRDMVGMLRRS